MTATALAFNGGEDDEDRKRQEVVETMLAQEIAGMRKRGDLKGPMKIEGRCRVCQTEDVRRLVNKLLSHGLGYTEIVSCLEPINKTRRKNQQITLNSVREHSRRHFSVQEPARALYRTILERRAKESEADYIRGIGHHVNVMSYLETMMVKGYQELVSEERNVSVEMGMNAGIKLHKLIQADKSTQNAAEQLHQMNKIIAAVKEVVPETYFTAILAKLEDNEVASIKPAEPRDVEDVDIDEIDEIDPDDNDIDDRDSLA